MFETLLRLALATLVLATCTKSGQAEDSTARFIDITAALGIDFVHDAGEAGDYLLPEITGSGLAMFDYDGDGDLDLYFLQAGRSANDTKPRPDGDPNRLYRQEEDGKFTDVTESSGLGDRGYGMGVAVGDIDNDGDLDVLVTNYGADRLYINEDGRFRDATESSGLRGDHWSASAVFCDYDADLDLDLYITHYVSYDPEKRCTQSDGSRDYCSPQVFSGTSDALYQNQGDGRFADVSAQAGIRDAEAPGLGVVCLDLDGDRLLDFYVANDGAANQLWVNQGDGTFLDEALVAGAALNDMGKPEAGMGITVGDLDDDFDLDLFMTHIINETNTLYLNDGLSFEDATTSSGLAVDSLTRTGFGTAFLDYDHDGDLDLAIANGRVQRNPPVKGASLSATWNPYAEPNQLMRHDGSDKGLRYVDVSTDSGDFGAPIEVSRGLAIGDLDSDGDLDLAVINTDGQPRVYRNESKKLGQWLIVRAEDPESRRLAHGALVTAVWNGRRLLRTALPGYGYMSSHDPRAHFGLPDLPEGHTLDAIEVLWPDGLLERFPGGTLNEERTVSKGSGERLESQP